MSLQAYISKKVLILTTDGRTLIGKLESFDQQTNLILSETVERIIRPPEDEVASSEILHGLYLVRGDNVVLVGGVEEELDASIDWTKGLMAGDTRSGEVIAGKKPQGKKNSRLFSVTE